MGRSMPFWHRKASCTFLPEETPIEAARLAGCVTQIGMRARNAALIRSIQARPRSQRRLPCILDGGASECQWFFPTPRMAQCARWMNSGWDDHAATRRCRHVRGRRGLAPALRRHAQVRMTVGVLICPRHQLPTMGIFRVAFPLPTIAEPPSKLGPVQSKRDA